MQYREIEFKYNADSISLAAFTEFCKNRQPSKTLDISGYDYFFENTKVPGAFCRHRVGPDTNQLTFKRKTSDANSNIRTEHNIDLDGTSIDQVQALVAEFGYEYNTKIFKSCFIYWFEYYVLSWYVCYDSDMKELGRFMEIEAREDYSWKTEQEAWDSIVAMEKFCKSLGISHQSRIKRSLFELYKKELK